LTFRDAMSPQFPVSGCNSDTSAMQHGHLLLVLTFLASADAFSPILSSPPSRSPTTSLRAEEELRITLDAYTSPIRSCRSFNRASLRKVSGGAPKIGTAAFKEQLAEVPLTLIDVRIAIDSYTLPIPNCRSFNRASLSRFRQGSGGAQSPR